MPTLYQNIRGSLNTQLATVSGLPEIAYEGEDYTPDPETAYVEAVLQPTSGRPSSAGPNAYILHQGLFLVNVRYPSKTAGVGTVEAMADTIKASFTTQDTLTLNGVDVRIRFSERGQAMPDAEWTMVPVTVGWFVFSSDY